MDKAAQIAKRDTPAPGYRWVAPGESLLGDDEALRKDGTWLPVGEAAGRAELSGAQIRRVVDRALVAKMFTPLQERVKRAAMRSLNGVQYGYASDAGAVVEEAMHRVEGSEALTPEEKEELVNYVKEIMTDEEAIPGS